MDIFQNSVLIIIVGVVVLIIVIIMAVYFYQKTKALEEEVSLVANRNDEAGNNENRDLVHIRNQLTAYGRQSAAQQQINLELNQRLEQQQVFIDAILKELRDAGIEISLPALPSYNKYPPKHDAYMVYPNHPPNPSSPPPHSYPPQSYPPPPQPPQYPTYPQYPPYHQAPQGRGQEQIEVIPSRRRRNESNTDDLGI